MLLTTPVSDRNRKEHFISVDGDQVLRKLRAIPVQSWNYIGHDPDKFRHYGPVAQDFFAAFGHDGVGIVGSETTINSGDMAGILMAAVKALEIRTAQLQEKTAELHERQSELRVLSSRLERLEELIAAASSTDVR